MITPRVGFVVYGVHKDGLEDPMGTPFIDEKIVKEARESLKNRGVELVEYDLVIASKEEARIAMKKMKDDEQVDCVILFFFFKQKTAYEIYQCDWSSDVCSSDLC